MIATREELAWAAGLFEGEGCITGHGRNRRKIAAIINMTDLDVLARFQSVIGFGGVSPKKVSGNRKPCWSWSIGSFEEVQALVAFVWPWLLSRRRAAAKKALMSYVNSDVQRRKNTWRYVEAQVLRDLKSLEGMPLTGRQRTGKSQTDIAKKYGISTSAVTLIKKRAAYKATA